MRALVGAFRGLAGLLRGLAALAKHPGIFAIVVVIFLGIVGLCILISIFRKTGSSSSDQDDRESLTSSEDLPESDSPEPVTSASVEHDKRLS